MNDDGATRCLNCQAILTGPWCANCGQKHELEIHTFAHFAGEAFENITHADSRLWQTLWILVSRPGFLTKEFFSGRRMRYLPPVRFYLIVSVVFFLLAGTVGGPLVKVNQQAESAAAATEPGNLAKACDKITYSGPFKERIQARLPIQCRKILADNGRNFAHVFLQNVPRALFVMLPLLAAIMMLMYWSPPRHYVEHLLLLLHNHIFVFIGYGLMILLGAALPDSGVFGLLTFLFNIYAFWYFYRGMRVVYVQRRLLTLSKFILLGFVYLITAIAALVLTVLFSAITL